ncbi:MAG: DUF4249 family protein [Bacteroidetes bacterium]|nr:DUF4249 family protein [Bacteroidota bacterium]
MRYLFLYLVASLVLAIGLSACEESVNPILESDQRFTIFGTLDMDQDTQYVRVIPIRRTLETDASAPLNVTFTSTDLVAGETITWRDSLVNFPDGSFGHVFYSPLHLRPGHTYRIEVRSPDSGVVTSAETTVPAEPQPIVMPETVEFILTTQVRASQQILWQGIAEEPYRIEQWYRFFTIENFGFQDIRLPYVPINGPAEGQADTWEITLNLVRDRDTMETFIELNESTSLAGLGLRLTLLDEAFVPPGGAFDPEVLAQPGTLSNVENGFGFVGSIGRFSVEWLLADTSAKALRYIPVNATIPKALARLKQDAAGGD